MKRNVYIFWSFFVTAAVIRVLLSFHIKLPDIGDCLKQSVTGEGIVSSESTRTATGQVLVVDVNALSTVSSSLPCGTDISLRMKTKAYPTFNFGDDILFQGTLSKPFNFSSGGGRSFDFKGYLAKDDIYYEIVSAKVTLAKFATGPPSLSLSDRLSLLLFKLKSHFVDNLNRTLGEPHAALAAGLVVGEKAALGKDLLQDFRTVGLIHIVVLSGFNITIVAAAMRRVLSFLPRVWGIVLGGIGMALFGVLVGGGATVVRSCLMASVALFADLIRHEYNVVRALAFAALLMLIQSPMILLHDPSFQLSFLATLGLILLASPIEAKLTFIPDRWGMRGVVASTMATQIFVSPYILYMMGQLSIIGVVVNILVLPFIPATMLFVFLTGATGMIFLPIAQFFGWITHFLLSYELGMVTNFAKLPFASIHVPPFSAWFVFAFYLLFALFKFASAFSQFKLTKKSSR